MNIKDYFSFTRGEKRGTVVLLLIILVLIIVNFYVDLLKTQTQTDFSEFDLAINAFEKELNSREAENKTVLAIELFAFNPNIISNKKWAKLGFKDWQIKSINNYKAKGGIWKSKAAVKKIYGLTHKHFEQLKPFILLPDKITHNEKTVDIKYFNFDPNTISKSEWATLGFKDWQIKTIFNYKAKGGFWKSKADVKNIYGLNEADYNKLASYILLPEKAVRKEYKKDFTKKVDINTADTTELTNLKGINSQKYAAIIIEHRDKIGGFASKEQLKEVWNMTDETFNGLINQIVLGKYMPKKVNINSSSAAQLQRHPFIDWKTANAIFKYRKANGEFKKVEDLKKIHLINTKTYLKIAPYLIIK